MRLDNYPNLKNAVKLMGLDNNMINRIETEDHLFQWAEEVLGKLEWSNDDLAAIDQWLSGLTQEQLDQFVGGMVEDVFIVIGANEIGTRASKILDETFDAWMPLKDTDWEKTDGP